MRCQPLEEGVDVDVDGFEDVGEVSSRMERDFMRSATAIVAGVVGVLG